MGRAARLWVGVLSFHAVFAYMIQAFRNGKKILHICTQPEKTAKYQMYLFSVDGAFHYQSPDILQQRWSLAEYAKSLCSIED